MQQPTWVVVFVNVMESLPLMWNMLVYKILSVLGTNFAAIQHSFELYLYIGLYCVGWGVKLYSNQTYT